MESCGRAPRPALAREHLHVGATTESISLRSDVQQQQQLERNDADIKELRAKIKELEAALNASIKETLLF